LKKIGLALGSGSARGFAHIGVLAILEEHGIRPDYVAGTSIGAAIGALYCSGMSPEYMKRLAITTEWQDLLDFTIPKTGMIEGNNVEEYIQSLTDNCRFADLRIPLSVVATDIRNAHKVVFTDGNVAKAVRASISIPGVFSPVYIDSHELVDGGLVDPCPIDVVRKMGADIVIAVDLSKDLEEVRIHGSRVKERSTFYDYVKSRFIKSQVGFFKEFIMETRRFRLPRFVKKYLVKLVDKFMKPGRMLSVMTGRHLPHIIDIAVRSMLIMEGQIYKENLQTNKVEVVIRPDLGPSYFTRFEKAVTYIEAGEKATRNMIPQISRLIRKKKKPAAK